MCLGVIVPVPSKPSSTPPASFTAERAVAIAREAHAGHVDKAGAPYVEHPLRVMARFADDLHRIVAVLHDVVEDCSERGFGLAELAELGVPTAALAAIEALTHRSGEPDEDYWHRLTQNPVARAVKLVDIGDNADPARLALLPAHEAQRLTAKYERARRALAAAPPRQPDHARPCNSM